jgi:hypothetical protein
MASFGEEFARHPTPTKPIYISESWYSTVLKETPLPPKSGDKRQIDDEAMLRKLQKSRAKADCGRANLEVQVSLGSFFGAPNGPLSDDSVKQHGCSSNRQEHYARRDRCIT